MVILLFELYPAHYLFSPLCLSKPLSYPSSIDIRRAACGLPVRESAEVSINLCLEGWLPALFQYVIILLVLLLPFSTLQHQAPTKRGGLQGNCGQQPLASSKVSYCVTEVWIIIHKLQLMPSLFSSSQQDWQHHHQNATTTTFLQISTSVMGLTLLSYWSPGGPANQNGICCAKKNATTKLC